VFHCYARARVDALAQKESLNGMLRCPGPLLSCVGGSSNVVGRIGDQANVRDERLDLSLVESVAVGWHEGRLVERGSAVADDGSHVIVAHPVEGSTVGEWVRLDLEIVVI
jgi:hypothetical protein